MLLVAHLVVLELDGVVCLNILIQFCNFGLLLFFLTIAELSDFTLSFLILGSHVIVVVIVSRSKISWVVGWIGSELLKLIILFNHSFFVIKIVSVLASIAIVIIKIVFSLRWILLSRGIGVNFYLLWALILADFRFICFLNVNLLNLGCFVYDNFRDLGCVFWLFVFEISLFFNCWWVWIFLFLLFWLIFSF